MARKPALPTFMVALVLSLLLESCEMPENLSAARKEFYVAPDGDDANPGTKRQPWATINHAAKTLEAGQTAYIREGTYRISEQIRVQNSGTESDWIVFAAFPGEEPVIDAQDVGIGPIRGAQVAWHDQGAFQIEGVSYVRVQGLGLRNSHNAGFMVRDSHHVDLVNNQTDTTFSPGIAVWDTNHDSRGTEHIRVIGNSVTNANTWDMVLPGRRKQYEEAPHEGISIAGAQHFEVAYNHVFHSDKEGIDVKEVSKHGKVHHNYVHHVARQGLYVDSWFGVIDDIEVYENVVHDCQGAGFVLSVEGGELATDVRVHHNLIYNNWGTGLFFSRWGDGPRKNVRIYNNTIHHNGYGPPGLPRDEFFWITGGVYLFSKNLEDIDIHNNIVSDNQGFQIGYAESYLAGGVDIETALRQKKITIAHNLIHSTQDIEYPIYVGWPENYSNVFAYPGTDFVDGDPVFNDPVAGDFRLQAGSPAIDAGSPESAYDDPDGTRNDVGAYHFGAEESFWWRDNFPPLLD
jgi:hypothetical protein